MTMWPSYSTQKDTNNSILNFIKNSFIDHTLGWSHDKENREKSKEEETERCVL